LALRQKRGGEKEKIKKYIGGPKTGLGAFSVYAEQPETRNVAGL
jgi:hypothetical protein